MGAFLKWKECSNQWEGQVLKSNLKWPKIEEELKQGKKLQYFTSSCLLSKIMLRGEWSRQVAWTYISHRMDIKVLVQVVTDKLTYIKSLREMSI